MHKLKKKGDEKMRYTTKLFNTKKVAVMIPVFFPESGDKGETENTRRMNGFYDELKSAVFGYADSESFPEGGRYFAKAQVTEDEDELTVKVTMRLRREGRTLSERTLTHTWKNGVVIADSRQ